ncbi:hypothetical protein DAEQUDRAFT_720391 [Daedalea quercina L-15889]|uniref:DNA recombination and repair protein Rad51-like C-terminal domain-containing protein n=1 Tax=Daedalea quercina L-15889 TaxID=1314783 RepID=A0A165UN58_9APHY|nr:hypothetical protein DAEQUDRAFT_720391 [Daedalea quercina L-15889]
MDSFPTAIEMLAQVPTESMQGLLTSLRYHAHPFVSTCIPALDEHMSSLNADHPVLFRRGDVVEIQGPAASGKSHLLHHLLATCVLPSAHESLNVGGWGCAAVLFDADGRFNIKRFRRLLLSRLSKALRVANDVGHPPVEDQALEDITNQCLSRLHIFRSQSSTQLAVTLMHLHEFHSSHSSLQSCEIGLIALDSLSACYWNDRFLVEQWRAASESAASMGVNSTEPVNPLRHVTIALQRFRVLRGPLTVLTNWGLNLLKESAHVGEPYPLYKQHLHPFPSPFNDVDVDASHFRPSHFRAESTQLQASSRPAPSHLTQDGNTDETLSAPRLGQEFSITHHITLSPTSTVPFPPSLALSEMQTYVASSPDIARSHRQQGLIRTPASTTVTRMAFRVTEDDIIFEQPEQL